MQTLRLFCDVARYRSFSQAAVEYGITQSAVSQRIGQLEKRLGTTLLDRSVRPLDLTMAGKAFLHGCRDLLQRYERLAKEVGGLRCLEGHVRVSAIYSAGIDLLNEVRQRFALKEPGVTVTVDYKRPEAVYEEVRHGRCDLGIVSYPRTWRNVSVLPLRQERMVAVCQPNHPLADRVTVQAEDLGNWPMVSFESQLPAGRHIRKYLRQHQVTTEFDAVFDNVETIKSAVEVTDRVAILPRRTALREVGAGTLAVVELEPPLMRPIGVIYGSPSSNGKGLIGEVEAFVNFLLQHAGPDADIRAALDLQETSTEMPVK